MTEHSATRRLGDSPPVRIERLAAGGDGVGRLDDGRTLFVPRSAPGDLIEVADLRLHKRFARARIGTLVEAGPGRVTPKCGHYDRDRCGGCQWQHLDLEHQRRAKSAVIGDALRRLGKLDVADPEVIPPVQEFGYRTKIALARGKDGRLGLHREGEPDRIFQLERCELIAPKLQATWEQLRPLQGHLPKDLERLILRLDRAGGVHLVAETATSEVWTGARQLAEMLGRGPAVSAGRAGRDEDAEGRAAGATGGPTLWWRPAEGSPRVVAGGEGRTAYPATVFEQVNPVMGDQVRAYAVEQAGEVQGKHCWDLYAGIGETTVMLVARGATVESIEGDRRAVEVAHKHPGLRTSDFGQAVAGKVEDLIGRLRHPHLVITNPPRVGMEERAVEGLKRAGPSRLVYVSCDPATLARDVARLGGGYRVVGVKGFDLFPQTAHVETVLTLEAV